MLGWLLFLLIGLVALFYLANGGGAAFLTDATSDFYLGVVAAVLALYALWLFMAYRERVVQALAYLLVWTLVCLGFVAVYAYREDFNIVMGRVFEELAPPGQIAMTDESSPGKKSVRVRGRGDGHFVIRAKVNGSNLSLLVDTGASAVVLTPAAARRAGIDVNRLSFSVPVSTANGLSYAAPIKLEAIAVGGIVVRNVEALVAKPGSLKDNLLGMSFLRRLGSYEFSKNYLTLRS